MKKSLIVLSTAALVLSASTQALALGDCRDGRGLLCEWRTPKQPAPAPGPSGGTSDTPTVTAPEIDAGSGAMGIAVLVAGLLLVGEGLRRRKK